MIRYSIPQLKWLAALITGYMLIAGTVLLVRGCSYHSKFLKIEGSLGAGYDLITFIAMSFGAILLVFGIFGTLAVFLYSYGMLLCYFCMTLIVSLMLLGSGLYLWMEMKNYQSSDLVSIRNTIESLDPLGLDDIQQHMECCGVYAPTDHPLRWLPTNSSLNMVFNAGTVVTTAETYSLFKPLSLVREALKKGGGMINSAVAYAGKQAAAAYNLGRQMVKRVGKRVSGWAPVRLLHVLGVEYGDHFTQALYGVTDIDMTYLPTSCCKNPHYGCYGDIMTTWQQGCVQQVGGVWYIMQMELCTLLMSFGTTFLVGAVVIGAYHSGVKEFYYL